VRWPSEASASGNDVQLHVFEGVTHWIQHEVPQEVNERLTEFLR
jgi:pimeloyl-ACP methyl ester carboxylesterase